MRTASIAIVAILIVLTTSMGLAVAEERPVLSASSPKVKPGEKAESTLKLSLAPRGLAGYLIVVSLENGDVADIVDVKFPKWARLEKKSIAEDSAEISAVDLDERIQSGAKDVKLATMIFENTVPGRSAILISIKAIDDDDGNPIGPKVEKGTLTVVRSTHLEVRIEKLEEKISKLREDIKQLKARKPPGIGLIYGSLGIAIIAIITAGLALARRT